jgi:hypothetical protein
MMDAIFQMLHTLGTHRGGAGWMTLLALFVGYLEQQAYNHNYRDNGWHLFGWLNPRHHIPMVLGIAIACTAAGVWWFTPLFLVFEDAAYFLFNPNDDLDPHDWIARGLGGFSIAKYFIPWIYVVGIGVTLILLWLAR